MKRLRFSENRSSRIVNQTVLDFYGIRLNPKKDLADLDKTTIHAIKQAMIFAVTHRYPDQFDWITCKSNEHFSIKTRGKMKETLVRE